MKIAGIIRQDTGVGLYRIGQPIQFAKRYLKSDCRVTPFSGRNLVTTIYDDGNSPTWNDKTIMEICRDADVIFSTIIYDPNEIIKMMDLREWSGAKWVVDIDDDLYNVSPDNPAKENVERLKPLMEACLRIADGVTVSVPRLKEVYGHLNDNIYVNPNGQDIKMWDNLRKSHKVEPHKKIRIGWRGASGHTADVRLVEPAINALKKDYDIEFVTLGVKPPFKSEHHTWVGCLEFPKTITSLDIDIAVVPLIDKPYNRSKSNIAVQEFGMLKIPVVASPVENQNNMPVDYAVNNYEWYEAIKKLIENKKYRKAQGENLYNHIKKHWSVEGFTPDLVNWMEKLPRKDHKPE